MNTQLWNEIEKFDLDNPNDEYGFSTRLAFENSWTIYFTKMAILEYKKFMYLAATSNEMVSPSEIVDIVWHQHLIFTQSYKEFCDILGKKIEPVIKPLGYDWKIGIALITSFAAREVFVGTMATLYSVEEDNNSSLREKLRASVWPDGKPVYSLATALSLMVFYVLAMQCMSTLAIVKRETGTWKWPTIQFFMMTGLAYVLSWLTYVIAK